MNMTDQTRAKKGRRKRRSASQLFLAALVVFGIIASVLMLFTESVQWMRVGVLSALWAAVIGAFAMTKYRREAAADQIKAKDLQTVYELQLAREISARREYEMNVEARVRSESQLEIDEVAALRNELAALRQNLQVLFDGNLPTERVALRAEAMRMQELGGRGYDSYQPAPSGLYVPGRGNGSMAPGTGLNGVGTPYDEPVTAETSVVYPEDPDEMPQATASAAASSTAESAQDSYAEDSFEETSHDTDASDTDADPYERPAAQARPYGAPRPAGRVTPPSSPFTAYDFEQTRRPAAEPEPEAEPEPQATAETEHTEVDSVGSYSTGSFSADSYSTDSYSTESYAADPFSAEPNVQSENEPAADRNGDALSESRASLRESADAFFAADHDYRTSVEDTSVSPRRGRRRAESTDDEDASGAHSNGRSVAEIMAGLQGGGSGDAATTDPGTRRRRRRAD
ncbi:transmembrane protein rich in alanine and arginine and proline [Rhodococcus sp. B7740]|nr:transmembrane protein rich in alanine and arginine and proline [Rhodococcus sp. B7740]